MPSRDERRRHYDTFIGHVRGLCRTPRIRKRLTEGRGRPVEQCAGMDRYLTKPAAGFGARRAHYTVASLIALERPATDWTDTVAPPAPGHHRDAPDGPPAPAPPETADWRRRPTLGATLAQAARAHPHAASGLQRDLEVMGVLSADPVHRHLPRVIGRLLKLDAACDFAVLLEDLAQWDFDRLQVASRWRHDFFLTVPDTLPGAVMYDRYLDLHAVQHYPPSCLNRDDHNMPKTLTIGNTSRPAVSPQNQRRNWRLDIEAGLGEVSARTRELPPRVAEFLREAGWPEDLAHFAAGQIARSAIPKGLDTNPKEGHRTQAMLLVAADSIVDDLAAVCTRNRPALEKGLAQLVAARTTGDHTQRAAKKPPPALLPTEEVAACLTRRTATISLFGRMLAGLSDAEVTSAVQTAPAFTTHTSDLQPDFFTTVEDWPAQGDRGSAHLDTAFLTTGAFYRFTTVNLTDLARNLDGSHCDVQHLLRLFIRTFIMTVPPAKKTSTAPHTVPDLVAYAVRDRRPVSYAGAFEQPVQAAPQGGYLTTTYQALDAHAGILNQLIGTTDRIGHGYATAQREDAAHLGTRHGGFDALIEDAATATAATAPLPASA